MSEHVEIVRRLSMIPGIVFIFLLFGLGSNFLLLCILWIKKDISTNHTKQIKKRRDTNGRSYSFKTLWISSSENDPQNTQNSSKKRKEVEKPKIQDQDTTLEIKRSLLLSLRPTAVSPPRTRTKALYRVRSGKGSVPKICGESGTAARVRQGSQGIRTRAHAIDSAE